MPGRRAEMELFEALYRAKSGGFCYHVLIQVGSRRGTACRLDATPLSSERMVGAFGA